MSNLKKELIDQFVLVTDYIKSVTGDDYRTQYLRADIEEWKGKNIRSRRAQPSVQDIQRLLDAYNLNLDAIRKNMPLSLVSEEVAEKDEKIRELENELQEVRGKYMQALERLNKISA